MQTKNQFLSPKEKEKLLCLLKHGKFDKLWIIITIINIVGIENECF